MAARTRSVSGAKGGKVTVKATQGRQKNDGKAQGRLIASRMKGRKK